MGVDLYYMRTLFCTGIGARKVGDRGSTASGMAREMSVSCAAAAGGATMAAVRLVVNPLTTSRLSIRNRVIV